MAWSTSFSSSDIDCPPAALGITQRINIWTMWGIVINLVESQVTLQSSFDLKLIQNDIGSEGKRTFRH